MPWTCRWDRCTAGFLSRDELLRHVKEAHIIPLQPLRKDEIARLVSLRPSADFFADGGFGQFSSPADTPAEWSPSLSPSPSLESLVRLGRLDESAHPTSSQEFVEQHLTQHLQGRFFTLISGCPDQRWTDDGVDERPATSSQSTPDIEPHTQSFAPCTQAPYFSQSTQN